MALGASFSLDSASARRPLFPFAAWTRSFSFPLVVRHVCAGLSPFSALVPVRKLVPARSEAPFAPRRAPASSSSQSRRVDRRKRPRARALAPLRVVVPALVQVRLAALDQAVLGLSLGSRGPAAQNAVVLLDAQRRGLVSSGISLGSITRARHAATIAGDRGHRRRAGLRAVRHHRAAVVRGRVTVRGVRAL